MGRQVNLGSVTLTIIVPMVAMAPQASAEPINRSNWVPNVWLLNVEGEKASAFSESSASSRVGPFSTWPLRVLTAGDSGDGIAA